MTARREDDTKGTQRTKVEKKKKLKKIRNVFLLLKNDLNYRSFKLC